MLKRGLIPLFAFLLSCNADVAQTCVPGDAVSCAGPAGCDGSQICSEDGSRYSTCECGPTSTSASSTTSAGGAGGGTTAAAGGAAVGGAGGGPAWSPNELPGLTLWLDADVGTSQDPQHAGTVLNWQDQSPSNLTATATGLQDGYRFDYLPGAIAGHNAIRCPGNGTSFQVLDTAAVQFGTSDFLIAMVVRGDALQGGATRFFLKRIDDPSQLSVAYSNPPSFELALGTTYLPLSTQDAAKFHVVIAQGQSARLEVDGTAVTDAGAGADVSNPGAPLHICMAGSSASTVAIAEVLAVKGATSSADVGRVRAYLKGKFGL
jgi:hypothetical protein